MKVKVKEDKRLGLRAGIYDAKPYVLDPADKLTILDKKGNEICNQYRSEVEIICNGTI